MIVPVIKPMMYISSNSFKHCMSFVDPFFIFYDNYFLFKMFGHHLITLLLIFHLKLLVNKVCLLSRLNVYGNLKLLYSIIPSCYFFKAFTSPFSPVFFQVEPD